MILPVPSELTELAKIFKKHGEKLYLVGGYIRNLILGIDDAYNVDIDICSSARPDAVMKMLAKTDYRAAYMNEELGVIEIEKNIRVEYACFRKEKYEFHGAHIPNNVEFIDDINEDAKRRDFKCNAIYYDILEAEIVDPLEGVLDINNKIIRTTIAPSKVFAEDGERILRMVRFAATLGFEIEKNTYDAAKENVSKLRFISKTRIREEFSRIVLADTKFPFLPDMKYAHARGVMMLFDLGAMKYILPATDEMVNYEIYEDRGKLVLEHVMNVFALSDPKVRLSALLHDVGKTRAIIKTSSFNGADDFAKIIIEKNLGEEGLGFSKKIVERVKRVVLGLDFNKYGLETAKNIRHYIAQNYQDIELILLLKSAINFDKYGKKTLSYSSLRLKKIYENMKRANTPFLRSELDIDGNDLINNFTSLRENRIGKLIDELLYLCVDNPNLNNKEALLNAAEKIIRKNKREFLEG